MVKKDGLKKAGFVVLSSTVGVLSLSGMAFAGEAPSTSDDSSSSSEHHEDDDKDHGKERGGSCDRVAFSGGGNVVDASNLLANSNVDALNILSSIDNDCDGGRGGEARSADRVAFSGGGNVVDASNLLANSNVSALNILSSIDN